MPKEGIRRGPLTADEKAEIERLACAAKNPNPGVIAARISRHPSTVTWFMIRRGLIDRKVQYRRHKKSGPVMRNGVAIHSYGPDEDRMIVKMRRCGLTYSKIAEALTKEFGIRRDAHSVHTRHVMLTAYDDGEEKLLAESS